MSLGKVSIIVEAAMAQFESDMGRASRILEKEAKRWQGQLKKYEDEAKRIGKAIGTFIAAGATAAAYALKQTINQMDNLSKAAQKVGLPTEELSRLNAAAELADVSLETLTGSLGKLTKSQASALKETSQQAQIFRALGIEVTDVDGKLRRSSDVLSDFADRFAALEGSPEATAAGFAIFGRSFQELIPLIKDGGQAIRNAGDEAEIFGIVVSSQAGKNAEEFNDNLTRLKSAAAGLAIQVATDLLPDLVELTDNLVQLSKDGDRTSEVANNIRTAFDVLAGTAKFLWAPIKAIGDVAAGAAMGFVGLMEAAKGVINLDWDQVRRGVMVAQQGADLSYYGEEIAAKKNPGAYGSTGSKKSNVPEVIFAGEGPEPTGLFRKTQGQVQAEAEVAKLQEALRKALAGGNAPAKKASASKGKTDAEREAESLKQSYDSLIASQKERIALFGKETEEAQVTYDVTYGGLAKLTQAEKDFAIANAQKLDTMRSEKEVSDELLRVDEQRNKSAKQLIDDLNAEAAGLMMSAEAQEIYNNLRWAGVEANSALGESITEATKRTQQARTASAALDDLRQTTTSLFVDLMDYSKKGKDSFRDFVDSIRTMMMQLLAEALMKKLIQSLTGGGADAGAGGGSGGGGWVGAAISFFGSLFGGGKAGGGSTQRGKFYEVNEQGPELYSAGGRTWLMAGARNGHVTPMNGGGSQAAQPVTVIAVFGEDQLNAEIDKRSKSPAGERIAVTHFQRNKKVMS